MRIGAPALSEQSRMDPKYKDRWDSGTRDTRSRMAASDSVSGWEHSTHSTFAEPSRIGEQPARQPRPRRRGLLLAGLGIAAAAGAAVSLVMRGRRSG